MRIGTARGTRHCIDGPQLQEFDPAYSSGSSTSKRRPPVGPRRIAKIPEIGYLSSTDSGDFPQKARFHV